jgi:hypothetical protein
VTLDRDYPVERHLLGATGGSAPARQYTGRAQHWPRRHGPPERAVLTGMQTAVANEDTVDEPRRKQRIGDLFERLFTEDEFVAQLEKDPVNGG